jgi:hypothetical protein
MANLLYSGAQVGRKIGSLLGTVGLQFKIALLVILPNERPTTF